MLNALLKSSYIMSMALPWSSSLEALAKKGNEMSSMLLLAVSVSTMAHNDFHSSPQVYRHLFNNLL